MTDFENRVDAQRKVLAAVNKSFRSQNEELGGLSQKAIDRWVGVNGISREAPVAVLLRRAAEVFQCLAPKSQEQVTDEYRELSEAVGHISREIEDVLVSQ